MAAAACCSGTTPSCTRRSTGSATRRCARRSRATRAPHTSSASRSTVTSPDTSPSSPSSPARAATGGSRAKPGPPLNRYARSVRFRADRPLRLAPATVLDYRELARRRLPRQLFDYVDGGAYEESTLRSNVDDLERLLLRQVVMRDVSTRDQSVEVLGQQLPMPVVLAPVGLGGMLARRAEVQAARAAESAGVAFVESPVSVCSIEAGARKTSTPPWFQLYVMRDRGFAEELMSRARDVGSPVLVLALHLAVVGARHRDTRNAVVGSPSSWAKLRRGLDIGLHPTW